MPRKISDSTARTYATMTVVAAWLAYFCLFAYRSSFSVFQQSMLAGLGWTTLMASSGYCVMMTVYAITSYFAGSIVDKGGPRATYVIAMVCCFLGFFLTATIPLDTPNGFVTYLLTYGLFAGVGTGMLSISSTVTLRKWFVGARYGTMYGIAWIGAPLAQLLVTQAMKPVLQQMGWQVGMKVLSVIMAVLLLVAVIVARKIPELYADDSGSPRKPFGDAIAKAAPTRSWTVGEAFRIWPSWGVILAFLFSMVAEFLVWSQIVSYFQVDMGLELDTASNIYVIIGVCGLLTMPLGGKVSDILVRRFGNERKGRKFMMLFAPACGIAGILLALSKNVAVCCVAMVILSVYWALEPANCAAYAGSVFGGPTFGKIWGLCTLITMGIGPSLGTFAGAALRDAFGSFVPSLVFALASYAVSIVVAATLPTRFSWDEPQRKLPED